MSTELLNIIWAFVWFTVLGGVLGVGLSVASKYFHAEPDPREEEINAALPGANCGGCGYAGCQACANAIYTERAKPDACPVCTPDAIEKIANIMGTGAGNRVRYRAQVMCSGTNDLSLKKYRYEGISDCVAASRLSGGDKLCPNGCIGLGTCAKQCKFDAIKIINGVAAVDFEKCRACGMCIESCPKKIIRMIPFSSKYWVGCRSADKGAVTRKYCEVGCIACGICERACKFGAIKVIDNTAQIDYTLCTNCGECERVCPRKIIWSGKSQLEDGMIRGEEDLRQDRGIDVHLSE